MIYLFKCRNNSEDVFSHLYDAMRIKGYRCIRLIDEKEKQPNSVLKQLKGKDFKLITSDHIHISPPNSMSILEIINDLKPKAVFYGIHDLAILDIGYDKKYINKNMILLLPGDPWSTMYKLVNSNIHNVGYPRFIVPEKNKSGILFAVSLVYVYKDRKPQAFINDFSWMIKNNIPIKFPDCTFSNELVAKVNLKNVIQSNCETFPILNSHKAVISNSASSICVESAIAGCVSINIGDGLGTLYKKFNIHQMKVSELNRLSPADVVNLSQNKIHEEYLFQVEKAISIITS